MKKSPKQALTTNDTHELDVRSLFAISSGRGGMPGLDFACQRGGPVTSGPCGINAVTGVLCRRLQTELRPGNMDGSCHLC